MAFKVKEISETSRAVEAEEPLWLKADGETVVAEGDPEAASLLVPAGGRLSPEDAERYGLMKAKSKGADKQRQKPADKQRSSSKNK